MKSKNFDPSFENRIEWDPRERKWNTLLQNLCKKFIVKTVVTNTSLPVNPYRGMLIVTYIKYKVNIQ